MTVSPRFTLGTPCNLRPAELHLLSGGQMTKDFIQIVLESERFFPLNKIAHMVHILSDLYQKFESNDSNILKWHTENVPLCYTKNSC